MKDIEKLPDPPPEEKIEQPDTTIEVEGPATNATAQSVDIGSTTTDVSVGFSDAPDVPMSNVLAIAPSNSPLVLPGVMAGRSKGGRVAALRKFGGGPSTERSVSKGLNWLRDHQNADGSWGEDAARQPALTGLALLAFLAHGETPGSQEYGTCVLKAIRKLIEFGSATDAKGLIKNPDRGYGHAIVAYALAEAYSLTKIPMIEEVMNKTMSLVVTGQSSRGTYNYFYNNAPGKEFGAEFPTGRADLSVAGWNYQALKAAFAASCTVKGLETAIENGIKGIQKDHFRENGSFRYTQTTDGPTGGRGITPVGVLCLQLLGAGKSTEAQKGLKWIETSDEGKLMTCDWASAQSWSIYQWYYQTQAIFQGYSGEGPTWKRWNQEFTKSLLKEQEADGHWSTPEQKYGKDKSGEVAKGHFKGEMDLNVYSTSLCCLMLEVYYRYLPTFKVTAGVEGPAEGGAAAKAEAKDELKIE
ncbi:MAG: hypothetical protein A2X45_20795 [Lentisphaerae bacterium GWF2_50_93]|nr:MAG: hypothetical protein A2X45_20795 [Lentisphaerae bacterium GWF2_50_93]